MPNSHTFTRDLVERVVWTFLQAFLATFIVGGLGGPDFDLGARLGLAGAAGLAAVVKAIAATQYGRTDSAALLPGAPEL